MLSEAIKAGKRRIAFVTLEWFQSHVYVHMASQALPAAKILSTHIAGTPFPVGHLYVLVVLHLKWYVIMLFDAMVYPDIDHVKYPYSQDYIHGTNERNSSITTKSSE